MLRKSEGAAGVLQFATGRYIFLFCSDSWGWKKKTSTFSCISLCVFYFPRF